MAVRAEQLELVEGMGGMRQRRGKKEDKERNGRWGVLILLVVTTLISLFLYLKNKVPKGMTIPVPQINFGGTETITIEK